LRMVVSPAPAPNRTREARPGHRRDAPAVFTGSLYGYESPTGEQD